MKRIMVLVLRQQHISNLLMVLNCIFNLSEITIENLKSIKGLGEKLISKVIKKLWKKIHVMHMKKINLLFFCFRTVFMGLHSWTS